jgi:hypothetical protein
MYNFGRNQNQFLRKNVNICEKKKKKNALMTTLFYTLELFDL